MVLVDLINFKRSLQYEYVPLFRVKGVTFARLDCALLFLFLIKLLSLFLNNKKERTKTVRMHFTLYINSNFPEKFRF